MATTYDAARAAPSWLFPAALWITMTAQNGPAQALRHHRQHPPRPRGAHRRTVVLRRGHRRRAVRRRARRPEGHQPAGLRRAQAPALRRVHPRAHQGLERDCQAQRRLRLRHARVRLLHAAVAGERDRLPVPRMGAQAGGASSAMAASPAACARCRQSSRC